MQTKNCLLLQHGGIGDCLFLQKAAAHYYNLGYQIYWPVLPQLQHVQDYLKEYGIIWSAAPSDQKITLTVDFQTADRYYEGCMMKAKYRMINMDYSDWSKYLKITRNIEKEKELFKHLGLKDSDRYNLVNQNYGTLPHSKAKKEVRSKNELPNVILHPIEGYTLFDWIKVIEKASNIYTVDTSLLYIMEKLNLKIGGENLHLWPREGHYTYIDGLFKQPWTRH